MPSVSVLILNYNGARFIAGCLDSVMAQSRSADEVMVIDNASTDDSPAMVENDYPAARLVRSQRNLGFSGGMNLGIRQARGDFLLLLNTDVVLDRGCLEEMEAAMKTDPRVGAVTGKVYRLNGGSEPILDTTGHVIFNNRLFIDRGDGEVDVGQYERTEEVFGVCAGAGLYRRAMLEDTKVGEEYFDESFFMFLEDTDLSWRARLRGWKCLYAPAAVARHYRGGTAKRRTRLVETHNYKNRYMMLLKNDSLFSLAKNAHHLIVTDTLKSGALLVRFPLALLGWFDVWRNLPALLKKRRIIQKSRRIDQKELERWFVPFAYRTWIARHLRGFK